MIDFSLLKNNIWTWVNAAIPKTVTLTFPGVMAVDDTFDCKLNGRAITAMVTVDHNTTVHDLVVAFEAEAEVQSAIPGGDFEEGNYMTLTLTRRTGYALEITGALWGVNETGEYIEVPSTVNTTPVIWDNQNFPSPTEKDDQGNPIPVPYVMLMLDQPRRIGTDFFLAIDEDNNSQRHGLRGMNLVFQGIGLNSLEVLTEIADSLDDPYVIESLNEASINFYEYLNPKETSVNFPSPAGPIQERATVAGAGFEIPVPYSEAAGVGLCRLGLLESVELEIDLSSPDITLTLQTPKAGD